MIYVTGRTFDIRHALSNAGGRFDRENKRWEFDYLTPGERQSLERTPGIMVVDATDEPQDDEPSRTDSIDHQPDLQWYNYFAGQNPRCFWGFNNLQSMVKFIRDIPQWIIQDNERNDGWRKDTIAEWTGTPSMEAALRLASDGWPEGIELAKSIVDQLTGQNAVERRRKYSVAGGSINIGRLLSGNPLHMIQRPKQPGKKIVTFFGETFMSSAIDVDDAIMRAAIVAAIVDVLETNGFQCEIISITTGITLRDTPLFQIATTLKAAGEPLNIGDVVFALGHPSYFRRLCFAVLATDERMRSNWVNMGYPGDAFTEDHPTSSNEFYVNKIQWDHEFKCTGLDRAFEIWDIVTDGAKLPIEIKRR